MPRAPCTPWGNPVGMERNKLQYCGVSWLLYFLGCCLIGLAVGYACGDVGAGVGIGIGTGALSSFIPVLLPQHRLLPLYVVCIGLGLLIGFFIGKAAGNVGLSMLLSALTMFFVMLGSHIHVWKLGLYDAVGKMTPENEAKKLVKLLEMKYKGVVGTVKEKVKHYKEVLRKRIYSMKPQEKLADNPSQIHGAANSPHNGKPESFQSPCGGFHIFNDQILTESLRIYLRLEELEGKLNTRRRRLTPLEKLSKKCKAAA